MSLPSRNSTSEPPPSPAPEWHVPLSAPSFAEAEIQAASETLRSGWWTYGPVARMLEAEFAAFIGVPHAIAVSSGTAALHLAFAALGLEPGDEVLTPSLNFVAAANCICHLRGVPHFVDVTSLDRPLSSSEILERSITSRTRGICVMHYGGYSCSMDEVMNLARRRGLWVVEDSAHAPGARWLKKCCGAWGDVGCFSFFGNKNLTCAEGGMVTTANNQLAQRIKALRSHGMSSLTWDRYQGHKHSYDVSEAGFNYRIDDLRASILRVQLSSLAESNRRRAQRAGWYRELLEPGSRWIIPFARHQGVSAHHLFPIVLAEGVERTRVVAGLRANGVQSSVHYPPVHQFSFYRKLDLPPTDLTVTEALGRRLLSLPLYPDMTREQVEWVASSLQQAATGAESSRDKG
jgi:dTDP-4-amino-4,6-dideoxygalactose transaminase